MTIVNADNRQQSAGAAQKNMNRTINPFFSPPGGAPIFDGENGYLFEPGHVDELAARLTDVLTAAPEERVRMQQASLDGVAIHDITRTLDTFEALYRGDALPE